MGRGKVKTKVGVVTSNKMDKAVIVNVAQIVGHAKYGKPMKKISRFKAHDEKNECKIGDRVFIIETRPLSGTKRWRVSKVLERATIVEGEILEDVLDVIKEGDIGQ